MKDTPLNGSNPDQMGKWIAQMGPMGNYLLMLASGWPNGLNILKKYIVEEQASGANLTCDEFMVLLTEFAHTGTLPERTTE